MKSKLGKHLQALADEEWCLNPLYRNAWRKLSNGHPSAIQGEFVDHEFISRERPIQCQQGSETGKGQPWLGRPTGESGA